MDAMELRTISVFCGLDVGKGEHHATALDRDGHRCMTGHYPRTNKPCGPCSTS